MAAQTLLQAALVGGEVSPGYYGRVDLQRYLSSVKTMRNFYVQPAGGAKNRAGFKFIGAAKNATKTARLIPFVYSSLQTYVLEMGDYYMRVFTQGGQMVLQPATIAAISDYAAGTTYGLGDLCSVSGTYYYSKTSGNIGHAPESDPTYWLALTGTTVEIPTPWPVSALPLLKFTQSADVMTICHPDYPPYDVKRLATDKWTCSKTVIELGPFMDTNEDTTVTVFSTGLSGSVQICPSSAIFKASDVGRLFFVKQQNVGKSWVSNTAVTRNEIRRAVGNYYTALAAGTTGYDYPASDSDQWNDGGVNWQFLHPGFGIVQITDYPVSVTEAAYVAGPTYAKDVIVSYDGKAYASLQANNKGHQPDTSPTYWVDITNRAQATVIRRVPDAQVGSGNTTYKWAFGAWTAANGYPACTTYHQQRQVFAGTYAAPQTVWLSTTGDFSNFGRSAILQDKDSLTYPLDGRMVSTIKHVLTMGAHLVAFSSDSEWTISAPSEGALTPTDVNAKLQGYRGSSDLIPIMVGEMALYVQSKGQVVRDLGYDYLKNIFTGIDLTQYASHLVENHSIVDWAFQQNPASTVWCVRDDGALLSLGYVKEQQVMGWAQHWTDGTVESVCCVSEGQEDALYLLVYRTGGRYVERMANRLLTTDSMSACFLDASISYDGTNYGSTTITASNPVIATPVQASNEPFVPSGTSGQLSYQGNSVTRDAQITSLTRTDWQGTVALSQLPRTNYILHSDDFENWIKTVVGVASSPIVTTGFIGPDGKPTARRVEFNLNGGTTSTDISQLTGAEVTLSGTACLSYWIKSNDTNTYTLTATNSEDTGVVITVTPTWKRIILKPQITSGTVMPRIRLRGNEATSKTADILICKGQLELGSEATPPITTTTSPVTVTDYAVDAAGAVTLGETASGTYAWSGGGAYVSTGAWDEKSLVTLTASSSTFSASTDVGDEMVVGGYHITVTSVSSGTIAYGTPRQTIDPAYQGVATTSWAWARQDLSGLSHLEGKTVGVYGDGYVQSSQVVSGGKITLDTPAIRVWVGLPYVCDIETLDMAMPNGVPLQDKLKNISQVVLQMEATRGIKVGPTFDKLTEMKQGASYTAPPAGFTGPVAVVVDTMWSTGGHVCVRQDYPLPTSIQAIVPQVQFSQR